MGSLQQLDWRAFAALAASFVLVAWALPRLGIHGDVVAAHVASAALFAGLGLHASRAGRAQRRLAPAVVGGVLLGAAGLSLVVALDTAVLPTEIGWTVALTAAFLGMALDALAPDAAQRV